MRMSSTRMSSRLFDLSLIAIVALASLMVVLRVGLSPAYPEAGVAVVYPPWTAADQVLAKSVRAGARFVRFGGFDFIAVVMPETPDYVERALADSAILALDPKVLAACLSAPPNSAGDGR